MNGNVCLYISVFCSEDVTGRTTTLTRTGVLCRRSCETDGQKESSRQGKQRGHQGKQRGHQGKRRGSSGKPIDLKTISGV